MRPGYRNSEEACIPERASQYRAQRIVPSIFAFETIHIRVRHTVSIGKTFKSEVFRYRDFWEIGLEKIWTRDFDVL